MTQISVFPNSGHHYTFAPLSKEVLAQYPKFKELCSQERQPWRTLNHSWIRGRPGMKDGVPGFWVAVESNVGTIGRGSLHESERVIPESEMQAGDLENPSPYAVTDVTRLPDTIAIPIKFTAPPPAAPGTLVDIANLEVVWKKPVGQSINVDLIVDFGNTRTVVLGLEDLDTQNGELGSICKPIRFIKRGCEYEPFAGRKSDDTCSIVDSWFILHEPIFASLEPPARDFRPTREIKVTDQQVGGGLLARARTEKKISVTERVPQMFVELSPVVMGDSARSILGNVNVDDGGNYSMSSPKRYAWDRDPVGHRGFTWWTMVVNRWNPAAQARDRLPLLAGSMLRFTPTSGRDWDIDRPPNEAPDHAQRPHPAPNEPAFPRSDAMTWAALSILELAHRQITSEEWRKGNQPFVRRQLRNIVVTFPSGWSTQELDVYRNKWQRAVNIFTLAHLSDRRAVSEGGQRPELVMDLDEAVASQLPFVYAEIRRLYSQGENWIELIGRGKGVDANVRLMTVDIGGGTTDISIVQYSDDQPGGGIDLKTTLLFRDSSSVAGDALAKEIIEHVLLPSVWRESPASGGPDAAEMQNRFEILFKSPHSSEAARARWSRIVKLVFLPILRQWLRDLSNDEYGNPENGLPWAPGRIEGAEGRLVDEGALGEFNKLLEAEGFAENMLDDSRPLGYREDDLRACINRVFTPVIQSLAKYVTAFEVDLVTLSGKPSELPPVKKLLEELLPILPQRIIQARDFPAGEWYPMSSDHKIHDAKSVTAVGAALYQAIRNGKIPGWTIERRGSGQILSGGNYWGAMPLRHQPTKFSQSYLSPGDDTATQRIMLGTLIGRKILPSAAKPEQVYRFRLRDAAKRELQRGSPILNATLQRVPPQQPDEIEGLEIIDVQGEVNGTPVSVDDVELQLCTLEGEYFWIDNGRFEVAWPEAN